MLRQVLFALWVFLPAGIANATPVIAAKMPLLASWQTPLDFGKNWHGKLVFGPNKTWRGLISGMVLATLVLWGQQTLYINSEWVRSITGSIDYAMLPVLLVGPLFGLGALLGDAIESFFKRQRNIPSGKSWFPFDQTDYILGGLLVVLPFLHLSISQCLLILAVWTGMHLIVSYLGYRLKLKDQPI